MDPDDKNCNTYTPDYYDITGNMTNQVSLILEGTRKCKRSSASVYYSEVDTPDSSNEQSDYGSY